MSGRGGRPGVPLSDLLSKAKKQIKKKPKKPKKPKTAQDKPKPARWYPTQPKKRKKAQDEPQPYVPNGNIENLLQSYIAEKLELQAAKDALQAEKDALQDAHDVLREESEAQKELLQRYKGNPRALETCTDPELKHLSSEANTLLRSCVAEQYTRIQQKVNREYEEAQKQDCEILENLKCPICFNVFRDVVNIRCGHSFCKECLTSWTDRNNSQCPECRAEFQEMTSVFKLRAVIPVLNERAAKTDHKAKRIENYTAEHAALCTMVNEKHGALCAHMATIAAGALNRM